jgi:hypothetical protein
MFSARPQGFGSGERGGGNSAHLHSIAELGPEDVPTQALTNPKSGKQAKSGSVEDENRERRIEARSCLHF